MTNVPKDTYDHHDYHKLPLNDNEEDKNNQIQNVDFHKESHDDAGKSDNTLNKLKIASIICLTFMILEVIGGYFANSIAIMSDAAHLLSDFLGFIISIVSIYISRKRANHKMSFGYHRAEVIGALVSVCLIWGLTIWLLFEASCRLLSRNPVNGLIMLITALIGFIFNIVMGLVLAYQGIDNHLHHHHDEEVEGPHEHHEHGPHEHHEHEHHDHGPNEHHEHEHHEHENEEHHGDHEHHEHEKKHSHKKGKKHHHEKEHKHGKDHLHNKKKDPKQVDEIQIKHHHELTVKHTEDNTPIELNENKQFHSNSKKDKKNKAAKHDSPKDHSHSHDDKGHHGHHHGHSHENLNLKASLIHVMGDAIQNLGVVFAGVIIYFYPEYSIADPICTFIFSIIVVFTTIRILREGIAVLMEATPVEIDLKKLEKELQYIPHVVELHDLHVWSLSPGKLSLSCHLISSLPQESLKAARNHLKTKYKITHSTIQVELESGDVRDECSHDLHHEFSTN